MKAFDIANAFRDQFKADGTFTVSIANAQTGDPKALPQLVFACSVTAFNRAGTALNFTLTATVESNGAPLNPGDPDPAIAHAALVDAASAKLFTTGKTALMTALNALGTFNFIGWGAVESDPSLSQSDFMTPLSAYGTVLVL